MLLEIRSDFDRVGGIFKAARNAPDDTSSEVESMLNEYICVVITGRLEQNLKQIFIAFADNKSKRSLKTAVSKLCQSFQNPDHKKICELVSLFDKDFSEKLSKEWKEEGSPGSVVSDMVGKRKVIAHQTRNNRDTTRTKVDQFFAAYKTVVTRIHDHFLVQSEPH